MHLPLLRHRSLSRLPASSTSRRGPQVRALRQLGVHQAGEEQQHDGGGLHSAPGSPASPGASRAPGRPLAGGVGPRQRVEWNTTPRPAHEAASLPARLPLPLLSSCANPVSFLKQACRRVPLVNNRWRSTSYSRISRSSSLSLSLSLSLSPYSAPWRGLKDISSLDRNFPSSRGSKNSWERFPDGDWKEYPGWRVQPRTLRLQRPFL